MVCELMRAYDTLGEAEGTVRLKSMMDTIYKTRADTIAADRAQSKLEGKVTTFDRFYCATFEAADRKTRADSIMRQSAQARDSM